jgi:hypothetical protein
MVADGRVIMARPDLVGQGKLVAIHCRGGGCTGFMAVVILREMEMDKMQAGTPVKNLRPN